MHLILGESEFQLAISVYPLLLSWELIIEFKNYLKIYKIIFLTQKEISP